METIQESTELWKSKFNELGILEVALQAGCTDDGEGGVLFPLYWLNGKIYNEDDTVAYLGMKFSDDSTDPDSVYFMPVNSSWDSPRYYCLPETKEAIEQANWTVHIVGNVIDVLKIVSDGAKNVIGGLLYDVIPLELLGILQLWGVKKGYYTIVSNEEIDERIYLLMTFLAHMNINYDVKREDVKRRDGSVMKYIHIVEIYFDEVII